MPRHVLRLLSRIIVMLRLNHTTEKIRVLKPMVPDSKDHLAVGEEVESH